MSNPAIKQITLPTGTTYDLHDPRVDELEGFTKYLGVTTTELVDGSTTNPIIINGESVTAESGDIVLHGNSEFIFDGNAWNMFGDLSALGSLAYKNSASGTVAVPKTYNFSGTAGNVSVTGTTDGSISETKGTVTVSKASSGTATYTPAGTNGTSSVSGSCSVTPSGTIGTGTGTANYTPSGSVSGSVGAPTISVKTAGSTDKVTGITGVGTLPSCTLPTYTVSNEVLTITSGSFSAGTLPTADTQKTFKTGDATYQASEPSFSGSFSGTGVELKFNGSASTGTISGTAAAQKFTGTGARLVTDSQVLTGASFTGASITSTGSFTPNGSVTTATTESKTVTVT